MTTDYTFDPDTWPPALAGLVAGAIGAIAAALVAWVLTEWAFDQPHEYANSLTVVIVALVLGWISGLLWQRLRASKSATKAFAWAITGAFAATLSAVVIAEQTVIQSLARYAVPVLAVIFITLAFFTPILSRVRSPRWIAAIPVLLALALGVGLFL